MVLKRLLIVLTSELAKAAADFEILEKIAFQFLNMKNLFLLLFVLISFTASA